MPDLDLQLLAGNIVIVAPHMDDEALACGGLIAKLSHKERVHVIYATDGMKSPAPIVPGRDKISPDLGKNRMQESVEAMKLLGVPEQNLHFLCLPDAQLNTHLSSLRSLLRNKIRTIAPKHIFVPFRYDRNPDHLAVNHAIVSDFQQDDTQPQLIEYFVYYRWRLMPKRDIRKYIRPQFLFKLEVGDVAQQKRQMLDCFTSQTTIYYPWQTRPILTSTVLEEECQNPEYFLIAPASLSGIAVFSSSVLWIRLAHRLEPVLLRWKYLSASLVKRIFKTVSSNHIELKRPIRVIMFGSDHAINPDTKRFICRLEEHPEIEFLGAFCQMEFASWSARFQDLQKRRGVLAIPLLAERILEDVFRFFLHPREEITLAKKINNVSERMHFVLNIHSPEVLRQVSELKPDLGLIYGSPILKPELFEIPRLGTLGIHHGKVPEYRGSKTAFWMMYNDERCVGVTIQKVNQGLDTGSIVKTGEVRSYRRAYLPVLRELEALGIDLYVQAVLEVKHGAAEFKPQTGVKSKLYRTPKTTDYLRFLTLQIKRRLTIFK